MFANRNKRAFTLIELLVVVLILAILMAIAMPLYLSAVSDSQRKTCRANMQTIANTVASARVQSGASDFTALISGGVTTGNLPDLKAVPSCPGGGTYSLATGNSSGNFMVKCSLTSAHGSFEPGVDHN